MEGRTEGLMDGRTDSPCVLQEFVPFGAATLLPLNLHHFLLKQGTGTADHLLPLGCYSLSFFPFFSLSLLSFLFLSLRSAKPTEITSQKSPSALRHRIMAKIPHRNGDLFARPFRHQRLVLAQIPLFVVFASLIFSVCAYVILFICL